MLLINWNYYNENNWKLNRRRTLDPSPEPLHSLSTIINWSIHSAPRMICLQPTGTRALIAENKRGGIVMTLTKIYGRKGGKVEEQYPINSHMWAPGMSKKNMLVIYCGVERLFKGLRLFPPSLSLSIHPICLSIHLFISVFNHPFICSFIHTFISLFIYPFISVNQFLHPYIHPFIHLSLFISSSIHPFAYSSNVCYLWPFTLASCPHHCRRRHYCYCCHYLP